MPFSRARGNKIGADILKFQVWCFIDFWPLFEGRRNYRWHFCMIVQGQHIDTVNFIIWHFFQFDLLFALWPLIHRSDKEVTVDTFASSSKTNTFTFYFCHFTYFLIWPFFDLWPFNHRSDEEVNVDTYACLTNTNTLTNLLLSFDTFCDLTFLTFDPLSISRTKRSPWTLLQFRPRLTHWPVYFCHFTHL